MPGSQGQVAAGSSRDFDPGETMGTHEDSGLDCILDRQTMLLALGCSRPGDRLSEAIQTPSFRGDAKHRARNLEIPRCAIAHLRSGPSDHPGMTKGGLLRRFRLRSLSYGGQVAPLNDIKTPRSRGAMRPSLSKPLALRYQRAQGMPGARCTRSLVCDKKQAHEHSHHRFTGTTRHSPRNGFTAYFALSPVTRLV